MGVGPEFVVAKGPWDGMVREQRKKNELFEQDYQANEYQWKKEERKQREDLNHCKDSISKSYGNQHKKKKKECYQILGYYAMNKVLLYLE